MRALISVAVMLIFLKVLEIGDKRWLVGQWREENSVSEIEFLKNGQYISSELSNTGAYSVRGHRITFQAADGQVYSCDFTVFFGRLILKGDLQGKYIKD